jgi:hypothetical protein
MPYQFSLDANQEACTLPHPETVPEGIPDLVIRIGLEGKCLIKTNAR